MHSSAARKHNSRAHGWRAAAAEPSGYGGGRRSEGNLSWARRSTDEGLKEMETGPGGGEGRQGRQGRLTGVKRAKETRGLASQAPAWTGELEPGCGWSVKPDPQVREEKGETALPSFLLSFLQFI